ncbi:fructose-1,6-bisphosphatase [Clostridium sp. D2Q-14]|uniref:fructose-1,6-bisphosphatase n=1 Tax=Anaeromonas gelatinilytica TaxID=2683194 RepID=UPI00193B43D3|nr:fructose-1,6-bisphosphatase [Anaeromonas gelatinilytica]MBS4534830.1 fructose-1,6-bisphosphatase [Anaeromonas gelatinilytica]
MKDIDYLKLLSEEYSSISSVTSEIINLNAILNLPKGTEHFLTDLHGEYEAFSYVLRNASGVLKFKIDDLFDGELNCKEKRKLATLLYYPEEKLDLIKKEISDLDRWYKNTLVQLIKICRVVSSKYTRSRVRKTLPKDFAYIIEELLHEEEERLNKHDYFNNIIDTIIEIDRADDFIVAIANLIQRLAIDRLHIVGDIYDRGPYAHKILDDLIDRSNSVDLQWGNHDILWMGAASGSLACITNVVRIALRYANLSTLEEGYGINLLPLATFALNTYKDDECNSFIPKKPIENYYQEKDLELISKMHKAISIIQFKIEGQIIKNSPNYDMDDRLLLDKINYRENTIEVNNQKYKLNDTKFPTVDKNNPYRLTEEEERIINRIRECFLGSDKLQKHIKFLYSNGSMYLKYNSNLLYHSCVPMTEEGSFRKVNLGNEKLYGKTLFDKLDFLVRMSYFNNGDLDKKLYGQDIMWYLWCNGDSPLFGKNRMTTFERYFIDDKSTHIEIKDPYYKFRDNEIILDNILREFGLNPEVSHIINGHVPVKASKGESPIKGDGKLLVIDGGFSKAYQSKTGLAGYTLIYNSYGIRLASHDPFESKERAIVEETDILSTLEVLEKMDKRKYIYDTDKGKELNDRVKYLKKLLAAYRMGLINEDIE